MSAPINGINAETLYFVENGAGTYTGTVTVPAGSVILNIVVEAEALWDAATSASLEVGLAGDPDGYFTAVDLKAIDLLAGESVDFAKGGGVEGAYLAGTGTHWTNRLCLVDTPITATVTSVGAGTAGRTSVTVAYARAGLRVITV